MEALGAVGAARDMGTDVSVETCPHYLTFDESDLTRQGASLKCAPPIRDRRNREGLWRALLDGKIDFVASDHSPCPPDLKASADMFAAWGGVAGAQSLLPAVFAGASARAGDALDVRKVAGFVVWRLAARPAKRFGLWPRKGAIAPSSSIRTANGSSTRRPRAPAGWTPISADRSAERSSARSSAVARSITSARA